MREPPSLFSLRAYSISKLDHLTRPNASKLSCSDLTFWVDRGRGRAILWPSGDYGPIEPGPPCDGVLRYRQFFDNSAHRNSARIDQRRLHKHLIWQPFGSVGLANFVYIPTSNTAERSRASACQLRQPIGGTGWRPNSATCLSNTSRYWIRRIRGIWVGLTAGRRPNMTRRRSLAGISPFH